MSFTILTIRQTGEFSWARQQEEVMVGTHSSGPVRLMFIADYYYDSLIDSEGVIASVFSGNQYRFQPRVIFGRDNTLNYLEKWV